MSENKNNLNLSNWLLVILTAFNITLFYNFFSSSKAVVFANDKLLIQRRIEDLSFIQTLSFKNVGEKPITITRINGYIRSKDRDVAAFRKLIKCEFLNSGTVDFPFIQFTLGPGEQFIYDIKLSKEADRWTKDSGRIIHALIINEYQNAQKTPANNYKPYEASKKLSKIIDQFIKNRSTELKAGEYEYILEVFADYKKKPILSNCYSFFIYPDNIFLLEEGIKDFKRYNSNSIRPPAFIPLTKINNPEIVRSLERELDKDVNND